MSELKIVFSKLSRFNVADINILNYCEFAIRKFNNGRK